MLTVLSFYQKIAALPGRIYGTELYKAYNDIKRNFINHVDELPAGERDYNDPFAVLYFNAKYDYLLPPTIVQHTNYNSSNSLLPLASVNNLVIYDDSIAAYPIALNLYFILQNTLNINYTTIFSPQNPAFEKIKRITAKHDNPLDFAIALAMYGVRDTGDVVASSKDFFISQAEKDLVKRLATYIKYSNEATIAGVNAATGEFPNFTFNEGAYKEYLNSKYNGSSCIERRAIFTDLAKAKVNPELVLDFLKKEGGIEAFKLPDRAGCFLYQKNSYLYTFFTLLGSGALAFKVFSTFESIPAATLSSGIAISLFYYNYDGPKGHETIVHIAAKTNVPLYLEMVKVESKFRDMVDEYGYRANKYIDGHSL